jgi:hypothetical protein
MALTNLPNFKHGGMKLMNHIADTLDLNLASHTINAFFSFEFFLSPSFFQHFFFGLLGGY